MLHSALSLKIDNIQSFCPKKYLYRHIFKNTFIQYQNASNLFLFLIFFNAGDIVTLYANITINIPSKSIGHIKLLFVFIKYSSLVTNTFYSPHLIHLEESELNLTLKLFTYHTWRKITISNNVVDISIWIGQGKKWPV